MFSEQWLEEIQCCDINFLFGDDDRKFNRKNRTKLIFNPPATILIHDGEKYVSKVHNEEFDEEKGLLMCIAKSIGLSHMDIKRMLKVAERHTNKEDKD